MDYLSLLRQYKIGPFAIFDVVLSYIGVWLLAPLLSKLLRRLHLQVPRSAWLWLTLPVAVLFHFVFNQHTPLMKMLVDPPRSYIVIAVLLIMIFMGVKDIRKSSN